MLGMTSGELWLGLVMEFMPGGTLCDLTVNTSIKIPYLLRLQFCYDIVSGLSYLHKYDDKKRMTHGDLKLENILLSQNLICKICDFGTTKLADITGLTYTQNRTPALPFTTSYAAPERRRDPAIPTSTAMDIFSLGIIFMSLLTREKPTATSNILSEMGYYGVILTAGWEEHDLVDFLTRLHWHACKDIPNERPDIVYFQNHLVNKMCKTNMAEIRMSVTDILKVYPINASPDIDNFNTTLTRAMKSRLSENACCPHTGRRRLQRSRSYQGPLTEI